MPVRPRRLLPLLTAVGVLLGSLGVAGPAHADSELHLDPRGDVAENHPREWSGSADILRLRSVHTEDTMRLRLDLADLTRSAPVIVIFRLRTSGGGDYLAATAFDEDGGPHPEEMFIDRTNGDPGALCPGFTSRLRPRRDQVEATVPRACLGDPAWVRTGAGIELGGAIVDDARRDGRTGDDVRVGPALFPAG